MLLDPTMLAVGIAAALLIGMAKGGLSGGLGVLVVPLLSLAMDPRTAAAVVLPILIVSDLFAIRAFWGKWLWNHFAVLMAGAIIGIIIGTLTFSSVSAPAMRLLMGLIALGFVASRAIGASRSADTLQPAAVGPGLFWGALSGFTSFTAHAGAPPVQIYLMPRGLTKIAFLATNQLLFTAINLAKVPSYVGLGQFTAPVMWTALILMPAAAVGVFLGFRLQNLIPEKPFFRLLMVLLAVTGIKLVYDGLTGLGWL